MHVNEKYLNRSNAETGSILQKEATWYYGIECISLNEALESMVGETTPQTAHLTGSVEW